MSSADYVAKYHRRRALKEQVETYWIDEPKRPAGTLDSSLKKHTTLLNRLKTSLMIGPPEALIKEIDALTLTKYLEEIVAAVVEGASRGKGDPEAAVDIIVHLHTRLTPDFLPMLLTSLLATLSPTAAIAADKDREKEDKERIAKQRPVLRIIAELAMASAWTTPVKGVAEVVKVLKGLMANDLQFTNLPLLAAFLKHFSRAYLGATDSSLPESIDDLVPIEAQPKIREMFVGYFNQASKTLVKGQVKLLEQDKRNHEAYIKSGEIFEDRQQAYERMTKAVERLTTGVQSLADLLGLEPPTLPTAASLSHTGLQIVESQSTFNVRDDGPVPGGIWDDEEEKRFYEDLVVLRDVVPAGLLGIKETKPEPTVEQQEADEADVKRQLEQLTLDNANGSSEMAKETSRSPVASPVPEPAQMADDDVPEETIVEDDLQSGPAARLSVILASLPDAVSRDMVDRLVVEFASLNSKAARKRLIKFFGEVPKTRTDLLPHYARFIATLDPYMPDVGAGVLETLDEEMRYLQRKRHVRELDSLRLKNVRFYGELAKFKVARPYTILHVFKVFLDDMKNNVENMANLLETCGRFLLRNEATAATSKSMVELMRRKQSAMHLDQRQNVMLENAFYMCNPPERVAREVVQLPPMQSFIQHLLHDVLMKRTLDKVLKLVRKLHWDDPKIYNFILSSFTEIWEVNYGNIPHVAALVYDLQRYHPDFSSAVVDQVMEDIRSGMEDNVFKYNQRRISTVRYLGELYMYRVINAAVIFDTLWSLISFGHAEGLPVPGRDSPIDAVDDFFRVRLVCTLLDSCGACFDRGSQKRKLDTFLVVFQLYVFCKRDPPVDVDFMVSDTLDVVRPKVPHLRNFTEAAAAMDELLATQVQEEDSESEGSEDERPVVHDEPEDAVEPDVELQDQDSSDEQDDVVVLRSRKHAEIDQDARDDFDREFAKILTDTTDIRRDRKTGAPIFDTAVPYVRKRQDDSGPLGSDRMAFTLLSKRGNRQQLRNLDIPLDSSIAVNVRSQQQQNKAEQEQLKRLVLQNERRQDNQERSAMEQDMRSRGIKLRFVPP
ncbi:armadillo-type protein [Kockovaella imperatae]|uniref:Armadillo-type protein n=1 Tax=Kockovaella imperatae TaxID=4999 RepID=A0A1Y1UMF1_9TREE|nr:armadillo-type protein [Kockovaella imperatae]ORX39238.1 armadillo-type protein [Kockovaella imperatae]